MKSGRCLLCPKTKLLMSVLLDNSFNALKNASVCFKPTEVEQVLLSIGLMCITPHLTAHVWESKK